MKNHNYLQRGYSFIEVIIIMAIGATLVGFIVINLLGSQHRFSLSTSADTLINDIKIQQLKSMVGSTEGRTSTDSYGIAFGQHSYTFFHGTSYNSSDLSNAIFTLDTNILITTTFPSSAIVFQRPTGEIANFSANTNTVTLKDTTNNQTITLTFNSLGIITSVQ